MSLYILFTSNVLHINKEFVDTLFLDSKDLKKMSWLCIKPHDPRSLMYQWMVLYVTCHNASKGMCFMSAGSMSNLTRAILIYLRVYLSQCEVEKQTTRATLADSIVKVITELLPLTEDCLREYVKPLFLFIQTLSVKCVVCLKSNLSRTGFHHCYVVAVFPERHRPKQRWVSFHYSAPLSSVILIWKVRLPIDFHHLPKAWWTAAWLDSHITHPGHLADINNQPFPSSLFGITRPYIRPNSH